MDGEKKRPVLKSPEELKGSKAGPKKRMPKWPLLLLPALLAAACFALVNRTELLQKAVDPSPTAVPSAKVTLIDKQVKDFLQATVSGPSIDPAYTVKSQIEYDADGKEIAKPEGAARYLVVGDPSFALNDLLVDRMLQSATHVTAQSTVAQDATDLSVFGLDAPQLIVDAAYKDGTKVTLNFGDKLPTGAGYYMSLDGQRTVYAVSAGPRTDLGMQLNELHTAKMPLAMDAAAATRVLVEQRDKATIELVRKAPGEVQALNTLWLRQPFDIEAHMTRAGELVDAVTAIALGGYAGRAQTPSELAAFGLDTPRARIVYEQDGESGKQALDMSVGAALDGLYSYCTIDGSGDVYTVETALLSFLGDATPAQLVDQFAGLVNIQSVDSLTVTGGATSRELSIQRAPVQNEDGTEGTVETFFLDGQPQEEKPFKALYQAIIGLTFDKFAPEGAAPPTAAPMAAVRFKFNNGQPDRLIEYVPFDGDYCLIRDGERALFLIKRQKVQSMLDQCAQQRAQ